MNKDEQINRVAESLGLYKTSVELVWDTYIWYLKENLEDGKTVKFLNVCYLKVDGQEEKEHETLAYISSEIASKLSLGQIVVYRILCSFEELLVEQVRKVYSYHTRGFVNIRLIKVSDTDYKVRVRKGKGYVGKPISVTVLGSFKRRVEIHDRENPPSRRDA